MTINWLALGTVAVVSIVATLIFVALLSGGIRYVSSAAVRIANGQDAGSARIAGWTLCAAAGASVLYGLFLIVPFFH